MRFRSSLLALGLLAPASAGFAAQPITIVAAENFYGDLARQVAGPHATVVSILSNPDEDPHLFEANAKTAKALADARVVISNGVDYDPWMEKMLAASKGDNRVTIVAGELMGRKAGDNPHLWYDPATMVAVANKLEADLTEADPAHKADYEANTTAFEAHLKPLDAKIAAMKKQFAGTPVTASEPVFGLMAQAIGLEMRNQAFQTAVMNNTEPSAADTAAFEDDLKQHKVKATLYNSQADDQAVKRLVGIAKEAHVPVVGVSETEPAGKSYAAWMTEQLDNLDKALAGSKS